MTVSRAVALVVALAASSMVSCNAHDASGSRAASSVIRSAHQPPSPKDVIAAALQSADVPLSVHESCRGVGTEAGDATLGRYLSGFLVELDPETGQNGLVTSVSEAPQGWLCRLMIRRRAGEEVWSWGLEFSFGKDGLLDPDSYRCIGAG